MESHEGHNAVLSVSIRQSQKEELQKFAWRRDMTTAGMCRAWLMERLRKEQKRDAGQ